MERGRPVTLAGIELMWMAKKVDRGEMAGVLQVDFVHSWPELAVRGALQRGN